MADARRALKPGGSTPTSTASTSAHEEAKVDAPHSRSRVDSTTSSSSHALSGLFRPEVEWQANVVDHATAVDAKQRQHAVFVIEVQVSTELYVVRRRYRQFASLHAGLERKFPRLGVPSLPPTSLGRNLNKDYLDKKRAQLDAYLQQLMSLPDVLASDEFLGFMSSEAGAQAAVVDPARTAVGLLLGGLDPTPVTVKAGDSHVVELHVPTGSVVVWEFKTTHYDIAFSVDFAPMTAAEGAAPAGAGAAAAAAGVGEPSAAAEGEAPPPGAVYAEVEAVQNYARFPSHRKTVQGSHTAAVTGLAILRWDNVYSRMRSKKVGLRVAVVGPERAAAAAASEEAERAKLRQQRSMVDVVRQTTVPSMGADTVEESMALRKQRDMAMRQLDLAVHESQELGQERETLQSRVQTLEARLLEETRLRRSAETSLELMSKRATANEKELTVLRHNNSDIRDSEQLLKARFAEQEDKLAAADAAAQTAADTIKALEGEVHAAAGERLAALEDVDGLKARVVELEGQLSGATDGTLAAELQAQADRLQATVDDLRTQVADLQAANAAAEAAAEASAKDAAAKDAEIAVLKKQKKLLVREVKASRLRTPEPVRPSSAPRRDSDLSSVAEASEGPAAASRRSMSALPSRPSAVAPPRPVRQTTTPTAKAGGRRTSAPPEVLAQNQAAIMAARRRSPSPAERPQGDGDGDGEDWLKEMVKPWDSPSPRVATRTVPAEE